MRFEAYWVTRKLVKQWVKKLFLTITNNVVKFCFLLFIFLFHGDIFGTNNKLDFVLYKNHKHFFLWGNLEDCFKQVHFSSLKNTFNVIQVKYNELQFMYVFWKSKRISWITRSDIEGHWWSAKHSLRNVGFMILRIQFLKF